MTNRTPENLSETLELLNWTTPCSPATLVAWAGQYLDSVTHDCPARYSIAATIILRECSAPTKPAALCATGQTATPSPPLLNEMAAAYASRPSSRPATPRRDGLGDLII